MPDLDVTEVLEDPDFADVFTVVRRFETVSEENGRSTIVPRHYPNIIGTVLAADPDNVERADDSSMTHRNIEVITRFRLRAATDGVQPDQILFNGSVYTVKGVKLWTRYGAGFVKASAVSGSAFDPVPV